MGKLLVGNRYAFRQVPLRDMRNYIYLSALLLCLSFALEAQKNEHLYLDLNGQPVSKAAQRAIFDQDRGNIISVAIDGVDWIEHRLVPRWEKGQLSEAQNKALRNYLEKQRTSPLPDQYQAVIIFYPGKDDNNSSGTATQDSYARMYDKFEKKLSRLKTAFPFYIYKDKKGLKRQSKNRDWREDTGQLIEQTFFKYHYPGGSYVVVDEKGNFNAYYGEYMIDSAVEAARNLKATN